MSLYGVLNIFAIIIAITGAILCTLVFFTQNKPDTYRFGLTVDQGYSASNNAFLMSISIWIGLLANSYIWQTYL